MKERKINWTWEIADGIYLAAIGIFNGWVALTQTAALYHFTLMRPRSLQTVPERFV